MSDLSPRARAFLQAHRRDAEATADEAERVRTAVAASLAGAAFGGALSAVAARMTLVKGVIVASVVSVVSVSIAVATHASSASMKVSSPSTSIAKGTRVPEHVVEEPIPPAPRALEREPVHSPARLKPATGEPHVVSAPRELEPEVAQAAPAHAEMLTTPDIPAREDRPPSPERVSSSANRLAQDEAKPVPPPTFDDEMRLVAKAQQLIAHGDSLAALDVLAQREMMFGTSGQLREEANAARIIALCASGHQAQGLGEAAAFKAEYPHSLQSNRLDRSCESKE